ncbi:MAG TPA: hypothetical protein VFN28_11255 [Amaricoccus sp.]|nr:hypothetical protein [Amaricoccus sp.]
MKGGGRGPRTQALVALCGAGLVLFNFPMLAIWGQEATVFGLPLLPVALFGIWAGLVVLLAIVSERGGG